MSNVSSTINNLVKLILTLSTLIIITTPTYSQSNSKILQSLQDILKDKNLYFESLDLIINKYNNNIFSREKKVLFPDYRKNTELQHHEVAFEDLIKVTPTDYKLLGQYPVDTIFFYFNHNKLIKCWYQFKLPTVGYKVREHAIDSIYNKLNLNFNLGKNGWATNIYGFTGYCWADDNVEVNFLMNQPFINDPKEVAKDPIAYFSIEMFKPVQQNNLLEKQRDSSIVKGDRTGKGNNTFTLSVTSLENIIKLKTTFKKFEQQLGSWQSFGNLNPIGAEYDEKTKGFNIPLYQINYDATAKNKYYMIEVDVSDNLKKPIKELKVIASLNGFQLAQFKESLHAHGYLLNENLSEILRKLCYQKKTGPMITIQYNQTGSYTIGVVR